MKHVTICMGCCNLYTCPYACCIVINHCSHQWLTGRLWKSISSALAWYQILLLQTIEITLLWRHNGCYGVWNHQPQDCLPNRLFRCSWKKTSKLRITGLCAGNSPVTGELPTQRASNAENVSIWWRHHVHTLIASMHLWWMHKCDWEIVEYELIMNENIGDYFLHVFLALR